MTFQNPSRPSALSLEGAKTGEKLNKSQNCLAWATWRCRTAHAKIEFVYVSLPTQMSFRVGKHWSLSHQLRWAGLSYLNIRNNYWSQKFANHHPKQFMFPLVLALLNGGMTCVVGALAPQHKSSPDLAAPQFWLTGETYHSSIIRTRPKRVRSSSELTHR